MLKTIARKDADRLAHQVEEAMKPAQADLRVRDLELHDLGKFRLALHSPETFSTGS